MILFALPLWPLACLALCALAPAHADDAAAGVSIASPGGARLAQPDEGDRPAVLSLREGRSAARGMVAGRAAHDTLAVARLKLPGASRPAEGGMKLGLARALAGGWSVTGVYSRSFGAGRPAVR